MITNKWLRFRDKIKILRQRASRTVIAQAIVAFFIANFIRLVFLTSRISVIKDDGLTQYYNGDTNAIFIFWHGRLMMIPPFRPKKRKMQVLISQHNDGELIAQTLGHFKVGTQRGSTSKGGGRAALGVVKTLADGGNISITPDGPRGPNRIAQMGVVQLAGITGSAIIPIGVTSSRHHILRKSWDKMQIALPFGHITLAMGTPIFVPKDASDAKLESYRVMVEDALNAATDLVDEASSTPATREAL